MKRNSVIMILLMLGSLTGVFAQDDNVYNYKGIAIRHGNGTYFTDADKNKVQWGEWSNCEMGVTIDLDKETIIIKEGNDVAHAFKALVLLDMDTSSNPANLLLSGMDICRLELAAIDWYLYKGQDHYLYLFYEGGGSLQLRMKRL